MVFRLDCSVSFLTYQPHGSQQDPATVAASLPMTVRREVDEYFRCVREHSPELFDTSYDEAVPARDDQDHEDLGSQSSEPSLDRGLEPLPIQQHRGHQASRDVDQQSRELRAMVCQSILCSACGLDNQLIL